MKREPLGGEDAAWLHMEDPTNPMIVSGLVQLGGTVSVPQITARLEERFLSNPRFRARVVERRAHFGVPRWERALDFDVCRHIEAVRLESGDEAMLKAFVSRAVSGLLDRNEPLWRLYVIDRPGAGTALLFRVHHAVADGFALLAVLLSVCDEGPGETPSPARPSTMDGGIADYASVAARLLTLSEDPATGLKGPLSRQKTVAWTRPLDLAQIKAIAKRLGATVNDVLVSVVSGALRRQLLRRGESPRTARAMVPVNLRPRAADAALGNRFGLVVLDLPIGVADPRERVAAVRRGMAELKGTSEAIVAFAILRVMGWLPPALENAGVTFFGKKASLVLTNVPGPRARLHLMGHPVSRIVFWAPQSGRMGIGVSILSYAGEVTIGVMVDAAIVSEPERLTDDMHLELSALETATQSGLGRTGAEVGLSGA